MNVVDILNDVIVKLPLAIFTKYGEPGVLRAMNRIYHNLNRECECLEKSTTLSGVNHPFTIPTDMIKIFDIKDQNGDQVVYVNPEVFDEDDDGFWTIRNNKIEISNYDSDEDSFILHYFSSGLELFVTVLDALTEIAAPEWPEVSLHSVLYYGTLTELCTVHETYQQDRIEFYRLKGQLMQMNYDRQSSTPSRSIPHQASPANKYIDEYEKPYTRDL
jgi:hypothetical protein